jgi:hypothetical protein
LLIVGQGSSVDHHARRQSQLWRCEALDAPEDFTLPRKERNPVANETLFARVGKQSIEKRTQLHSFSSVSILFEQEPGHFLNPFNQETTNCHKAVKSHLFSVFLRLDPEPELRRRPTLVQHSLFWNRMKAMKKIPFIDWIARRAIRDSSHPRSFVYYLRAPYHAPAHEDGKESKERKQRKLNQRKDKS